MHEGRHDLRQDLLRVMADLTLSETCRLLVWLGAEQSELFMQYLLLKVDMTHRTELQLRLGSAMCLLAGMPCASALVWYCKSKQVIQ